MKEQFLKWVVLKLNTVAINRGFRNLRCEYNSSCIIGISDASGLSIVKVPAYLDKLSIDDVDDIDIDDFNELNPYQDLIASDLIGDVCNGNFDYGFINNIEGVDFNKGFLLYDMKEKYWHRTTTCIHCNSIIFMDEEGFNIVNGDMYCEDCYSTNFTTCEFCGDIAWSEDAIQIMDIDAYYCESCARRYAYRCEDCGDYISNNFGTRNRPLCEDCADNYRECYECSELIHFNDAFYDEVTDEYYCRECYQERRRGIRNYGYKPKPHFYGGQDGEKLFMGFELESGGLPSSSDAAEFAVELCDDEYYLKSDASIPKYGFELVTHPMTLQYHKNFKWREIFERMINKGMRSHDLECKCGLHIHVSRDAISEDKWAFISWFVNKYRNEWETIARRKHCHYSRYKENPKTLCRKEYYTDASETRYCAVNFDNENTIEFRLFRGTLKYETVIAALEIVDAIVRWADGITFGDAVHSPFIKFMTFIKSQPEKYEHAITYLSYKGLME